MDSNALTDLFREVINDFSSVNWTPNAIVGWSLIILALLFSVFMRLFGDVLMVKWSAKQVAGLGQDEAITTKLRKFFFPVFTKDPNDEFKPFLPYWAPLGLGMLATLAVGLYISVSDNPIHIFIGTGLLLVAFMGCTKLARWQVRNNRW